MGVLLQNNLSHGTLTCAAAMHSGAVGTGWRQLRAQALPGGHRHRRIIVCHKLQLGASKRSSDAPLTAVKDRQAVQVSSEQQFSGFDNTDGAQRTDQDSWQKCIELLHDAGVAHADAENYIGRAFGWKTQAYWRNQKVEEPPNPAQVAAAIQYLKLLGIEGADLLKVLKIFPEALGCSVEDRLKTNVAKIEKEFKLTGNTLARAIIRQPQVLGYVVDCLGDCVGECNRCWARF